VSGKGFVTIANKDGRKEKVKKPKPAKTPIRKIMPVKPSGFCQNDWFLKGKVDSCIISFA
jgi:hypothetical protein